MNQRKPPSPQKNPAKKKKGTDGPGPGVRFGSFTRAIVHLRMDATGCPQNATLQTPDFPTFFLQERLALAAGPSGGLKWEMKQLQSPGRAADHLAATKKKKKEKKKI